MGSIFDIESRLLSFSLNTPEAGSEGIVISIGLLLEGVLPKIPLTSIFRYVLSGS